MMNRKILTLVIAATAIFSTFSCDDDDTVDVTNIVLNASELTLYIGEESIITASVKPSDADDQGVTWSSNYPDIASVDENGTVTAVSNGIAIITATTDDGGRTDNCTVTVKTHVSGVSLSASSVTIAVDETVTLTATVSPTDASNQSVTWTSGDTSIATVDEDGNVVGIAAGATTITVTTDDQDETASCDVTVE